MNVWQEKFRLIEISTWLEEWGMWAIVIRLFLNVVISILGVVPSVFLSTANVVVFGLLPGFFISWIGEVLGAVVSYQLYRKGFYKFRSNKPMNWKWLKLINEHRRSRQFLALLLARLTPFFPSGLITFIGAISTMRFTDFIVATLIGKAPSVALETLIGHDLLFLKQNSTRLLISLTQLSQSQNRHEPRSGLS